MKFFLISDKEETYTGMRLSGVDGVVVRTAEEAKAAIETVLKNPDIGMLLITENLANLCEALVQDIKLNRTIPLVATLPDRHGTRRAKDSITRTVRDAIGIKI